MMTTIPLSICYLIHLWGLGTGIKSTSDAHNSHTAGNPTNSDFNQTSSDLDDDVFVEKLSYPHSYKKVRALRIGSTKSAKLCGLDVVQRRITNTQHGLVGFDIQEDC
jgi:hypothetical protein